MSRIVEFPFLYLRDRVFPAKTQSQLEVDQVQNELGSQADKPLAIASQSR